MAMTLLMALNLGIIPVPALAEDAGGILIADGIDGYTTADIYNAPVAAVTPTPGQKPDLRTEVKSVQNGEKAPGVADVVTHATGGDFSQPPNTQGESKSRFAEDRVIVKLSGNYPGTGSTMSSNTPAIPLDLGINVVEMRLINPSKGVSNAGVFSTSPVAAVVTNTQNNVFVLTLEETGIDAVENALEILRANPAVEIAEPDYFYEFTATPNDPMFNAQYALERINAAEAWDITTGSSQVVVGVIDSGINGTHPDLIDNLWINPNPNQNGYVNDIHGYNFTGNVGGIPTDESGHGTHVAGIIGAKGNNGIGVSGINWNVSLAWLGIDMGGNSISVSGAIEALNYANNHNIAITNNSYGGPDYSEAFYDAISNYNGLFVAAAGNDYGNDNDLNPRYPASYNLPNVISVASTDEWDNLSYFSNYGFNSVHIAAPGSNIISAYPVGAYKDLSGTSMASPHVAGVAALIKAANPGLATEDVRDILLATARRTSALEPYNLGIVDAGAAAWYGFSEFITVTYDFLDAGFTPVVVKILPGARLLKPSEPLRAGYVFDGWHTQAQGGIKFDFSDAVNDDMTLYARWVSPSPGMYAVEFPDPNFRREVLRLLNENDGGNRYASSIISQTDQVMLASVTRLDVSGKGISDMTGLRYFTGIAGLDCSDNLLTVLNVTNNIRLIEIDCILNRMDTADDVIGWREIGLNLGTTFHFYPQKTAVENLQKAISSYASAAQDMVIAVDSVVAITSRLTIPANPYGKTLTITSTDAANPAVLKRRVYNEYLFVVSGGAKLVLENIIVDGNKEAYLFNNKQLILVGEPDAAGELALKAGAVLRDNYGGGVHVNGTYAPSTFTMYGGEISGNIAVTSSPIFASGGGGVYIYGGKFTMHGGKICGNSADTGGGVNSWFGSITMYGGEISGNTATETGGGMYMYSGSFTMHGGEISRNVSNSSHGSYGGGINVISSGEINIYDGKISENTANSPSASFGGGISLSESVLIMHGGEISGNIADSGGGVYIWNGSESTIDGTAEISHNTADSGGGVSILNGGELTMLGGKIINNISRSYGGGVRVYNNSTFTMHGGEISGNFRNPAYPDTSLYGGGVYVYDSEFTMYGGKISGNTAESGGGVYAVGYSSIGEFTMHGGEVSGNSSIYDGGGVRIQNNGAFTMTGGEISENSAARYGGGVAVFYGGEYTLGGGAIVSGNTRSSNGATSNVYLDNETFITPGIDEEAPEYGMNIGIQTSTASGVIVDSGAKARYAEYFHADDPDMKVVYEDGKLRIVDAALICILSICISDGSDITITLDRDQTLISPVDIPAGKTLTLRSAGAANPVTLTRGIYGNLFTVNRGSKLILENIIIDGNKDFYPSTWGSLVHVDGEFIMNDGAVLTNNGGRGVFVNNGSFAMNGGEISGNTSDAGGGVYVSGGGFRMRGGEISGNSASAGGGVYVGIYVDTGFFGDWYGGSFEMLGGKITGNIALDYDNDFGYGGGVFVEDICFFTMIDGEISGNTAFNGGGVFLSEGGFFILGSYFTMSGGKIIDNAAFNGGGVYISRGVVFDLAGEAVVSDNTATAGSGVYVEGFFTMNGGEISSNYGDCRVDGYGSTGQSYGGGVYLSESGWFDMPGGEISENRAGANGGGVFVSDGGVFNLGDAAAIWGNSAINNGGGVFINGELTMTGGEISGNDAFLGGGILAGGQFTMTGGIINSNTSDSSFFLLGVGGIYVSSGIFTLGGDAVINGNAFGNVYLTDGVYITLGTGEDAPTPIMNVSVQTETPDGVIVQSGANPYDTENFHADDPGMKVIYADGKLRIVDAESICIGSLCVSDGSDLIVQLDQGQTLASPVFIPPGRTITLRSADALNPVTLTRGLSGFGGCLFPAFIVPDGARLILEDIIIDGNYAYPDILLCVPPLVEVNGGEFIMRDGAVLKDSIYSAVGVYDGTFTMEGGEISGNPGGVFVEGDNGIFTMYGGEISGNGVGVLVEGDNGIFTMYGGEISYNTADYGGGGVFLYGENSVFTMYGGEISHNTTNSSGGGVNITGGEFIMLGGEISHNTAEWDGGYGYGGGVSVGDKFTMLGGEISGNTADYGGGVFVEYAYGKFTLGGDAVINGNTNNNVYLTDGVYITLSADTPPAPGMYVGVQTETEDGVGVIVQSGANPGDEEYFFADEFDIKVAKVENIGGQLLIAYLGYFSSELESIEITTPPIKTAYNALDALDLSGMVVTAAYKDGHTDVLMLYETIPADGYILNIVGQFTVTVSYADKTARFTITVKGNQGEVGDVNGDGVVNSRDVIALERWIAGWPIEINMDAADVNGDGVVNSRDVMVLDRHFAGWPGYETLPYK